MPNAHNPNLGTRQYPNVGNRSVPVTGYNAAAMSEQGKIAEAVKSARLARGWSQEKLAEEAESSQSTVTRIETGDWKRMPSDLHRISRVLNLDFDAFVGAVPPAVKTPLTKSSTSLIGERDLPVFASAEAGSGAMAISNDPVDYVRRPAPLANVKDGYALLVIGESMLPAFEPGDMLLVHPHLPPVPDTDVVLYHDDGAGQVLVTVKRLRKITQDTWHLIQWNPQPGRKKEFTLPRKDWPRCHRVVGKYSRR